MSNANTEVSNNDDFVVKIEATKGAYEIADTGQQIARIIEIIHIGKQESKGFEKKDKKGNMVPVVNDQFIFVYELSDDLIKSGEFAGQPKTINQFINSSTGTKSNLRVVMQAALGKTLTDEEASDVNIFSLLDKPVQLNIDHDTKKQKNGEEKTNARITKYGVTALHKSMHAPKRHYELRKLYLPKFNAAVFLTLPEWQQKLVNMNDVPVELRPKKDF